MVVFILELDAGKATTTAISPRLLRPSIDLSRFLDVFRLLLVSLVKGISLRGVAFFYRSQTALVC